jgi:hypothetical protein
MKIINIKIIFLFRYLMRNLFRLSFGIDDAFGTTPEGEPLESTEPSRSILRIIVPVIIGIIIISVIATLSVRIVDASKDSNLSFFECEIYDGSIFSAEPISSLKLN